MSTISSNDDIDISDFFANIPGHIYAKNKEGFYIAANNRDEFSCAVDGTKIGNDLIGKTDKDFPWKDATEMLQSNDREVMLSCKTKVFLEKGKLNNGKMAIIVSIKAPLHNKKGELIGIIGNSIDLTDVIDKLNANFE